MPMSAHMLLAVRGVGQAPGDGAVLWADSTVVPQHRVSPEACIRVDDAPVKELA